MMIEMKKQKLHAEICDRIYQTLYNGIRNVKSEEPRAWLKERGLTCEVTGAGFSSGQITHRKTKEYLKEVESVGFIRANNITCKNGDTGYLTFARFGIVFPLRDGKGRVVNFYGIRFKLEQEEHSFMNDQGIYPAFPHEMTTRLFITTSIMDAASMIEAKVLDNRDAVMCIPDGKILSQHEEAIKRLTQLNSIVWIESPKINATQGLQGRIMPKGYVTKTKMKP